MQASETLQYAQRSFQPIVERCEGCERIVEENSIKYCRTYLDPAAKWRLGMCNFATHAKSEVVQQARSLNPLKASKRAARSK